MTIGVKGAREAFFNGVIGWENIEDAENKGEQLPYSKSAMRTLPLGWLREVGNHVMAISQVTEGESKNSD